MENKTAKTVKTTGIKKSVIESLSEIFGDPNFKFGKISNIARVKIVRFQITLDPIAEEVHKAKQKAREKFMTKRLKSLIDKNDTKTLSSAEGPELLSGIEEFEKNMKSATEPLLNETVELNLDKLSMKEYDQILESNSDYMSGRKPMMVFQYLVDETLNSEQE